MEILDAINTVWTVFISIMLAFAWLLRLEAKQASTREVHGMQIKALEENKADLRKDVDNLHERMGAIDSRLSEQLSQIRESLARIEGRLLFTSDKS